MVIQILKASGIVNIFLHRGWNLGQIRTRLTKLSSIKGFAVDRIFFTGRFQKALGLPLDNQNWVLYKTFG